MSSGQMMLIVNVFNQAELEKRSSAVAFANPWRKSSSNYRPAKAESAMEPCTA
jgi:hypothetical protein